ncbi:hypothetical protein [Pseudomonas aeruginosa]|uniref:hypothetical protein n=1 Tax=Pseudomonas aeruginosa TaxID=287 RepID=UPI00053E4A1D|nr:hypothetical protein [Pseudomonas aeruginosa]EIU7205279.1 hypothetical protein [Pseudomonas aeruginosa]MBF1859996.1 GNAT family N-acetyltransferase [Pseudomonas aeruginosa]MBW6156861.1 hypothetical protein [Pseudomonas aeruginosa]MCO2581432.1 GNAT family N-acetyltransferase [Pseudomonas aeruginosa]MCO3774007.1 GNAT family N-acetyltransferase [Pseudomonas aeruginosa]
MTINIYPATLLEASTGRVVDAEIWDAITDQHIADWNCQWKPAMQAAVNARRALGVGQALLPQSSHWLWDEKARATKGLLAYPSFAVVSEGGTQGLMITELLGSCRCPTQFGKPLVYVHFIEVAPWNQVGLMVGAPRLSGVGSVLLSTAIQLSRYEGFEGRIGLHSLPQSNSWYGNKCGMIDFGPDVSKQGMHYFEMTPEQAKAFTV